MTTPTTDPAHEPAPAAEPTPPTVRLAWTREPRDATLEVDGLNIAPVVASATVNVAAHSTPTLTVELALTSVLTDVEGHATVKVGPETARVLRLSGWASPTAAAQIHALRAELDRVNASPTAHRHADGTVTVDWPDGAVSALVAREVIDGMLLELHTARAEADRLRVLAAEVLDERRWQPREVYVRHLRHDGAVLEATAAELAQWQARAAGEPYRGPDTTPTGSL